LAVYQGTCPTDNTNLLGCNDDFGGCASFTSEVSWAATGGVTYLLRLGVFPTKPGGTGTFDLTIVDAVDPVIVCAPNENDVTDPATCSATVAVAVPAASDNCGSVTLSNDFNNTASATDIYPIGTTTVTWTATDESSNTSTCTQDIIVTDGEDPVITCAPDQNHNTDPSICDANITVIAPTASDNCSLLSVINDFNNTPDASGLHSVGTTTITWTATDTSSNTSSCIQKVIVTDNENPTATCPPNTIIPLCDSVLTVGTPSVSDNCFVSTLINDYNNTGDASDTYPIGTTIVTWEVEDIYGNKGYCSHAITRSQPPTVSITPDPAETCYATDLNLNGNLVPGSGNILGFGWGGTGAQAPLNQTSVTFNAAVVGVVGPVTFTVIDDNNCLVSDAINVNVLENPTANIIPDDLEVCPDDTVFVDADPHGGTGIYVNHAWSGDSGLLNLTNIPDPDFSSAVSGTYFLTYVVTDDKGCVGEDDVEITVHFPPPA